MIIVIDRKAEKKTKLEIPVNTIVYEHPIANYWTDGSGIWYTVTKNTPCTFEMMCDNISFLKKIFKGKRVCLVADATHDDHYDPETRAFLGYELKNVCKALAIMAGPSTRRSMSNLFSLSFILNQLPIPMKMFTDEEEAKEWLAGYL